MAEVVWTDEAAEQLDQIIAYIKTFDPVAADQIGARLFDLGESLAYFPRRGRPRDDGSREMVTVPPFILRYEVQAEQVFIRSIRHSAREPQ